MSEAPNFTPREIVGELDRYIIGQQKAKRAVASALRSRWRRQQVEPPLRDEIAPKNIILMGPTGVGKTEIARRLAKLAHAPFLKVEASKFTEVGYVGRDVESIVRDLMELGVRLVRDEALEGVRVRAEELAEQRLVEALYRAEQPAEPKDAATPAAPFAPFLSAMGADAKSPQPPADPARLEALRAALRAGELETRELSLELSDSAAAPAFSVFGAQGGDDMEQLRELFSKLPGMKTRTQRRLTVSEARPVLVKEEAAQLLDEDRIRRAAVERVEQTGIVFLDEIDKVTRREGAQGADVSREGVQRDLLPIVEGSTVNTKYGPVKTDHILFIAAGAFHLAKVSDLIPELQGRFPIRVELESLDRAAFKRILTEPSNALTRQYTALLATEGVELVFEEDALETLADYAARANKRLENIGARRLHTLLEALLESLSFQAPEMDRTQVVIDAAFVHEGLEARFGEEDLARYVL